MPHKDMDALGMEISRVIADRYTKQNRFCRTYNQQNADKKEHIDCGFLSRAVNGKYKKPTEKIVKICNFLDIETGIEGYTVPDKEIADLICSISGENAKHLKKIIKEVINISSDKRQKK